MVTAARAAVQAVVRAVTAARMPTAPHATGGCAARDAIGMVTLAAVASSMALIRRQWTPRRRRAATRLFRRLARGARRPSLLGGRAPRPDAPRKLWRERWRRLHAISRHVAHSRVLGASPQARPLVR
eukprot:scaffold86020_cov33-Tisochrysis_lutea.AAC.1